MAPSVEIEVDTPIAPDDPPREQDARRQRDSRSLSLLRDDDDDDDGTPPPPPPPSARASEPTRADPLSPSPPPPPRDSDRERETERDQERERERERERDRDRERNRGDPHGPRFAAIPPPPPPPPPGPPANNRWASSSSASTVPPPRSSTYDDRDRDRGDRGDRDRRFAPTSSSSSSALPPLAPPPSLAPQPRLYGYTLPLPDDELVPRLIGKSGRVARQIQHSSGVARIASGHLPLPDRRDRPVPVLEFRGTLTEVHQAVQGVRQAVLDTVRPPPHGPSSASDDIAFGALHLDDWCVLDPRHLVLLSGPSDRSSMSDLLRAKLPWNHQPLSIELNNRVDTMNWKPVVEVGGHRGASPPPPPPPQQAFSGGGGGWGRARSPSSLNELSDSFNKKRRVDDDRYAAPPPPPPPPGARHVPDSVRNESYDVEIQLPFDAAPAVIGRAGRRMREIHDQSKARCRVNADDPSRNPTFCISGSVQQMRLALGIVQEIVRNEVDRTWNAPWLDEEGRIVNEGGNGAGGTAGGKAFGGGGGGGGFGGGGRRRDRGGW
ncbi:BQ2448_6899 [Microbotryum intermedium]|uniref:BQ2448_6899 protein n=1 Tax=Microbotryum intermedium TaxID=269621 RepID=A0A238FM77_9BASI|nr:BQ2448_6899 [Microbotryum intermedium]